MFIEYLLYYEVNKNSFNDCVQYEKRNFLLKEASVHPSLDKSVALKNSSITHTFLVNLLLLAYKL